MYYKFPVPYRSSIKKIIWIRFANRFLCRCWPTKPYTNKMLFRNYSSTSIIWEFEMSIANGDIILQEIFYDINHSNFWLFIISLKQQQQSNDIINLKTANLNVKELQRKTKHENYCCFRYECHFHANISHKSYELFELSMRVINFEFMGCHSVMDCERWAQNLNLKQNFWILRNKNFVTKFWKI